jgi:hypothetical protein
MKISTWCGELWRLSVDAIAVDGPPDYERGPDLFEQVKDIAGRQLYKEIKCEIARRHSNAEQGILCLQGWRGEALPRTEPSLQV